MENGTSNELPWGNVKIERNDPTIVESFFSQIILLFLSTFYNNTMTPQSQATLVKSKALRLSPGNLSGLECVKT
jgi:hypothetical protein